MLDYKDVPLSGLFGPTAQAGIITFFMAHMGMDYTVAEVEKYTGFSRQTVSKVVNGLLERKAIKVSRTVSRATFYEYDRESNVGEELTHLNNALVELIVEEQKALPQPEGLKTEEEVRKAMRDAREG